MSSKRLIVDRESNPGPSIGFCLTANIRAQSAIFRIYDTFTANANLLLSFTIMNTLDLENCLFKLYSEIHALVDSFLPEEEDDDMPLLEDIPDDFKLVNFYALHM